MAYTLSCGRVWVRGTLDCVLCEQANNRGFSNWNPVSLAKIPKCWTDSYFWTHAFRIKNQFKQFFVEVILISDFTNSEIRITSTFRSFCQADRISFRKTSSNSIGWNAFLVKYHALQPVLKTFCLITWTIKSSSLN